MINVVFIFNSIKTTIQCYNEDKMKNICNKFAFKANLLLDNIYFIYDGMQLNLELTLIQQINSLDKQRSQMNVLVYEKKNENENKDKGSVKSKEIICPECKDNCLFNIYNYKIDLFDCKNGHKKNILINEFINSQYINESKILCDNCKKVDKYNAYNKNFFKCITCKQNLCPLCNNNHNKNHTTVDYDTMNYLCEEHNDFYVSYCNICKKNLCMSCEINHDNKHNLINYKNILPNLEEIKLNLDKFREKINLLNNNIKNIINILNKVSENMELYYKINYDIYKNYDIKKKNYQVLKNIELIKNNIEFLEIDKITNNTSNNIINKFEILLNIYNKMESFDPRNKYKKIDINSLFKRLRFRKVINKELKNEITIRYKVNNKNKIKIFGKKFVNNNKDKCKIIFEKKSYDLAEYFDKFNSKNYYLDIKLIEINKIKDMSDMFYDCTSLSFLPDISNWNTFKVIDMNCAFYNCISLSSSLSSSPDFSSLDTSNVKNMSHMFYNCTSLRTLTDISKWNTSQVTNMESMFMNCKNLLSLPDISNWNIKNVENMSYMFLNCESLSSIPDISKWNLNINVNKTKMFAGCKKDLNIPLKFKD